MVTMRCLSVVLLVVLNHSAGANPWDPKIIERLIKPAVVSIQKHTEIPFEGGEVGEFFATGFVVDVKHGIIATNKHVSGTSPSFFKVSFYDGSISDATVLWYDPIEDFAFLRVKDMTDHLKAVKISSSPESVQAGDDVMLVGNNEGKDFSLKVGQIASLLRSSSSKRNLYWQTTFDRTGGASGSPVFNSDFEVVAIHAAGTDTTSMEVPIALLSRMLKKVIRSLDAKEFKGLDMPRGDIGARFSLEKVGTAHVYFGLGKKEFDAETKTQTEANLKRRTGSPPCVPVLSSLVPGSEVDGVLKPGDVLLKVNGDAIHCDLDRVAEVLDSAVEDKKRVTFDVQRLGKAMQVQIPVRDAEKSTVKQFLQIAGAVFHEITPTYRLKYTGALNGVWLTYAAPGSVFNEVGLSEEERPGYVHVLIQAVDGTIIKNLKGLRDVLEPKLLAAKEVSAEGAEEENMFLTLIDYRLDDLVARALPLSLESHNADFAWNYDDLKMVWVQKPLGTVTGTTSASEGESEMHSSEAGPTEAAPKITLAADADADVDADGDEPAIASVGGGDDAPLAGSNEKTPSLRGGVGQAAATNDGDQAAATDDGDQAAATDDGDQAAATDDGDQAAATALLTKLKQELLDGDQAAATDAGMEKGKEEKAISAASPTEEAGAHEEEKGKEEKEETTEEGNKKAGAESRVESDISSTATVKTNIKKGFDIAKNQRFFNNWRTLQAGNKR